MTAIGNLSTLINIATGGGLQAQQQVNWHKTGLVSGAAGGTLVSGRHVSLWLYDGQPGGATVVPTAASTVSSATNGSWMQTAAGGGLDLFLLSFVATATQAGSLVLYDRLVQHGGLSAIVTTAQATNLPTPALTRYTSGVGVEAWLEVYTQIGATGTTVKISYTNTVPTAGQVSQLTTFGGTGFREAQRVLPLPLAVGDNGVQAVASVTVTATTGTAGNFGVTLAYPLVVLPLPLAGVGRMWSGVMVAGGPLNLGTAVGTCFAMTFVPNGTTIPALFGQAYLVEN